MKAQAALFLLGLVGCGALVAPAAAVQPTAIVEDIRAAKAGVEWMDYLEPGRVIRLTAKDRLTVSYLATCARETITGGTVTIGAEQSTVQGGTVDRAVVRCGTGNIVLSASESQRGGALVTRSGSALAGKVAMVHALAPLLEIPARNPLFIQRLDKPQDETTLQVSDRQLVKGRFVDFSLLPVKLEAGGLYRVRMSDKILIFMVDPQAEAKPASVVSRLLRFPN